MKRLTSQVLTTILLLLGTTVFSAQAVASAAGNQPSAGKINAFAIANASGGGTIVVTGAIGDYGTIQNIDRDGAPNPNGHFVLVALKNGTFETDNTAFDKAADSARPQSHNTNTCSGYLIASAPVSVTNGTGLYRGISGTLKLSITVALVQPHVEDGAGKEHCDGNAVPVAQSATLTGAGNVRF